MFKTISTMVSGLLEKTDKAIILSRVEEVFKGINNHTIPMSKIDDSIGKDTRPMKLLDTRFRKRSLPVDGYQQNPIRFIRETFSKAGEQESDYIKLFKNSFSRDVFKESLTYDQAQLMTFLLVLEEASDYARRLFFILPRLEMDIPLKKKEQHIYDAVIDENNIELFAIVLSALVKGPKEINQLLAKIKEINYNPEDEAIIARVKGKSADPLSMNLIPGVGNLFVFFGELVNARTKKKYEEGKEELARLETTIFYLERRKEGASEEELARIQKQIDYYTDRINKLEAMIEDIEEGAKGYEYN